MKRKIYIPQFNEVVFDFMQMKPESFRNVDGEMRLVFELHCTDPKFKGHNLVLGINFNYNENAIDERFPNYRYTELDSIHSIVLYDYDIEYRFNDFTTAKILQIAKAVMPRQYTEILTIKNYAV
ncbi:hypothetical protein [Empedobacter brevis]|uniref:hypothetical protein n=1 Tax=Empedobacter brevis TaxID=247 RepID=UPI0028AD9A2B|nr:hypothetical protein [Empedobacter brevis]